MIEGVPCRRLAGESSNRFAGRLAVGLQATEPNSQRGLAHDLTPMFLRPRIHDQLRRQPYERLWREAVKDSDAGPDYRFRHLRALSINAAHDPRPAWYRRWKKS